MLVLTRKIGETIIIGDTIRVTVVDIGQGRVKLGIVAPSHIKIDREEIREKKLHEIDSELDAEAAIPVQMHNRISDQLPSDLTPQPTSKPTLPFHKKPPVGLDFGRELRLTTMSCQFAFA